MNSALTLLTIFILPWGIFFLLKRVVVLFLYGLDMALGRSNFSKRFQPRFDAAYDRGNLDEIIKLEEDAMYARLEELSKPRIKYDTRKMHLQHIKEWTAKNNYPGNRRQTELLLAALKANQRYPDLMASIAAHLEEVSKASRRNGNKANIDSKKVKNQSFRPTVFLISAWTTLFIHCSLLFIARLLDQINAWMQGIFWVLAIIIIFIVISKSVQKYSFTNWALAFFIALLFSNFYSFWNHLKSEPNTVSLGNIGVEVEHPRWLTADTVDLIEAPCGEKVTVTGGVKYPPIIIAPASKELEIFDKECAFVNSVLIEQSNNQPYTFYLQPKNLAALISHKKTDLNVSWVEPVQNQPQNANLEINFENLIWFYSRRIWAAGLTSIFLAIFIDILRAKIAEGKH